ncbi:MAG: biopolymer transporter ExbD [Nitrococcus sp.]|nr:biopolymer transporter ExbD [Nitrococcus sp.]
MGSGTDRLLGAARHRPLSEINVTPFVDVMLVLLIIFMVTAPMLAAGLKVDLPQAKSAAALDARDPIVITIAKDGGLSVANERIAKDQLIDAVRAKLNGESSRLIYIRGDQAAQFGAVVAVMDLLATNGLTHIAVIAKPHNSPAQPHAIQPPSMRTPDPAAAPAASLHEASDRLSAAQ